MFQLDPKTSIAYADRDRTNANYFHGFRVISDAMADPSTGQAIGNLLSKIPKSAWSPDVVREADVGIRIANGSNSEDLLLCTFCLPPTVGQVANGSEAKLSAETAGALAKLISPAFGEERSHH